LLVDGVRCHPTSSNDPDHPIAKIWSCTTRRFNISWLETKPQPLEMSTIMDPAYKEHTHPVFGHMDRSTSGPLKCALSGFALLNNPYFNKGSAFTSEERDQFGLHGMLPPSVQTLEEQVHRAYKQYQSKPDELSKNTFMNSLRVQNQVLFYRVHFRIP
jgi:hypothetical protein